MLKKRFLSLFLAAVMVLSLVPGSAWAADSTKASTDGEDSIVLDKTISEPDEQGNYTLNLEAYVTGETVVTQKRNPTDITIVLDVSGSMEHKDWPTGLTPKWEYYEEDWLQLMDIAAGTSEFFCKYASHDSPLEFRAYSTSSSYYYYGYYCSDCGAEGYMEIGGVNEPYTVLVRSTSAIGPSAETIAGWEIGRYTSDTRRIVGLQEAVKDFIVKTAEENNGYTSNADRHRIGMVKFASKYFPTLGAGNLFHPATSLTSSNYFTDLADYYFKDSEENTYYVDTYGEQSYYYDDTGDLAVTYDCIYNCSQILEETQYVTSAVSTDFQAMIDALIPGGATEANHGIALAQELVSSNLESQPGRQQIVLFFTDGSPTAGSTFEEEVATKTIAQAKELKDMGAKVYTISLLPEGHSNANNMHKYMRLVSSDYPHATSIDSEVDTNKEDVYHKTVSDMESLNSIFDDIISSVSGATTELDGNADLRDYMADGVELTDSTVITAYTVDYAGNGTWGTPQQVQLWNGDNTMTGDIKIYVDKDTDLIHVTGFDYAANYVADEDGTHRGKKLMITITGVDITEGAAVTEQGLIYTNKPTSGVYPGTDSSYPSDTFPMPYVLAENDAVDLNKTANLENDGTYTIDLEAFATGKPYSYFDRKPVDITIVTDLSTSMLSTGGWGTREEADWSQFAYDCDYAEELHDAGVRFAHRSASGELHEVEFFYLSNYTGYAYIGELNYEKHFSISAANVYGFYCDEPECQAAYTDSNGDPLPLYKITKSSTATEWQPCTQYYSFSPSDDTPESTIPVYLGLYYSTTAVSRLSAMQQAVTYFIQATAENNSSVDDADEYHRIGLVKFASHYFPDKPTGNDFFGPDSPSYTGLEDYLYTAADSTTSYYINSLGKYLHPVTNAAGTSTYIAKYAEINCSQILSYAMPVTDTISTDLQKTANQMMASGVTMSHHGMYLAQQVVEANKANATNDDREQIVLFFTDGEPDAGDGNGFNADYANTAIEYANALKAGGAKVYTIGLMPEDKVTANMEAFMQHASSNYPDATSLTESGTQADKKYHLLANNIEELNAIFDTITTSIGSDTTIELSAEAQLRDYLAQGFKLTDNTVVTVQTADYAGMNANDERTWKEPVTVQKWTNAGGNTMTNDIQVTVDMATGAVAVDGFSYKDNYVTATTSGSTTTYQGKKLMVTITGIEATDEAITNDMVKTNKDHSGIYPDGGADTEPNKTFISPETLLTSKIYVLDYAKTVTLPADNWMASAVTHLDVDGMNYFTTAATTADETYGLVNKASDTSLTYQPQTTLWGGYDSFYSFGKRASDSTENLWSKISVLPANNVYYEDTFVTTQDSSTVGIQYGGTVSWGEYTSATSGSGSVVQQWILTDLQSITPTDTVAITMSKNGTTWALPTVVEGDDNELLATSHTGTIDNGILTLSGDPATYGWNITANTDGSDTTYTIMCGTKYLYCISSTNKCVRVGNTQAVWRVSEDGYLNTADANGNTRYMGVYNNLDWRAYTTIHSNIAGQTLQFWKLTETVVPAAEGESGQNGEDVNGEVHGWITDLANDTGFSDGSAHGITLGDNEMAKATFKFTGTGVDVYTYTDIQSGIVQAVLMKLNESGAVVSMVKVHTIDNLAVSGEYYQIPTLSFTDLEYGSYMVSLSVAKAIAVNEDNELVEGEYRSTYYLDGIRVYNPIQNLEGDATVIEGYGNELGAVFQEVRSHLTTAASFNSGNTTVDGFVFIDLNGKLDGTGEEGDLDGLVADYVDYGPKHEVYLAPGQGIAFKVDNAGAAAGFYLGIKSPASKEGMVRVSNGTNQSTININHSTDLYYKLSPDSDGYIVVINEGSTLISLTKLRITGSSAGIVSADTEEMTAYVTGFRSLPQVDYIEQPEPPADPKPNPDTGELLEKILWLLENLFGSLRGWFDLP